ncbi:hypothetical protein VNO77_11304 [Canavalia gladiata]|uniref:Uncharacterized protein n=1 Tax=Canavalia gladiata TaxID=3824 RepID=A0AAN9MC14_CANGL
MVKKAGCSPPTPPSLFDIFFLFSLLLPFTVTVLYLPLKSDRGNIAYPSRAQYESKAPFPLSVSLYTLIAPSSPKSESSIFTWNIGYLSLSNQNYCFPNKFLLLSPRFSMPKMHGSRGFLCAPTPIEKSPAI